MKRILVTCGTGFIESYLREHILNEGNKVICFYDLFSSKKNKIILFLLQRYFEIAIHVPIQTIKTAEIGAINMLRRAELNLELTHSSSKIIHLPLPKDDSVQRQTDNNLTKDMLDNWKSKVQLKEGLQKTIEYFSQA